MRHAAERGHLVLGLGDFNMIPLSLAHRLIEAHAPVKDVWRLMHPHSAIGAAEDEAEKARGMPMPSADECLLEHGTTCDSRFNTWRWNKGDQKKLDKGEDTFVDGNKPDPKAKRLDYVFFGGDPDTSAGKWRLERVDVGMTARHPELKCSLSDHFSIEATLVRPTGNGGLASTASNGHTDKLNKGPTVVQTETEPLASFLPPETYDEILAMTHKYELRERRQRRLRLSHFGIQCIISIGCFVASWWSPRNYVCFILMLLSSFGLSAGVIDGFIGGLFVGSELRALKEFKWEILTAQEQARHTRNIVEP